MLYALLMISMSLWDNARKLHQQQQEKNISILFFRQTNNFISASGGKIALQMESTIYGFGLENSYMQKYIHLVFFANIFPFLKIFNEDGFQ